MSIKAKSLEYLDFYPLRYKQDFENVWYWQLKNQTQYIQRLELTGPMSPRLRTHTFFIKSQGSPWTQGGKNQQWAELPNHAIQV